MNISTHEIKRLLLKNKTKELNTIKTIRHFKRTGEIAPHTPQSIQIQTQSLCNGRCVYCPYPVVSPHLPHGKMPWETVVKIADEITQWRDLRRVELMLQNEPLMDKDLFKIVRYIKSIKPNLRVGTVTNATLLNQALAEELAHCGMDEVKISFDAFTKKTYEALHPGFSFERILESIDCMSKIKKDHVSVVLSFVFTSKNAAEFSDFVGFAKRKGLAWQTIYLLNRANTVRDYEKLRFSKYSWRYVKLRVLHKYFYQACMMPFVQMSVLFNGDVIICCQDWQRKIVIGNFRVRALLDLWNSDIYNRYRKKIANGHYDAIHTCAQCTLRELSE